MKHKALKIFLVLTISLMTWESALSENGCSFQGSWIGFEEGEGASGLVYFISQVMGPNQTHGTTIISFPGYDLTIGGVFPTAVDASGVRGVWEKTGGNSYAHTAAGFAVDENGVALYILKYLSQATLVDDCNVQEITDAWFEFYAPDQNPFDPDAVPLFPPLPGKDHRAFRMHVELP